jgi:predicted phosphodiesterase
MREVRKAAWVGSALAALAAAFLALCGIVDAAVGRPSMPFRTDWTAPKGRYRVAVLGDSQKGLANLSRLMGALKDEDVALYLHTGDLVSDNDEGHYRLVAHTLSRTGGPYPFFVAPGNHDVKRDPSRFERWIGPRERVVAAGPLAFVILDNSSGAPPDTARIEGLVAPFEAAVLLMHVPPFSAKGEVFPEYRPFMDWLERSTRVKYVLSGHVHAYLRREAGRAVLIANGVGGDYESWQHDQKVYATILDVEGTSIADRPLVLDPVVGLWANLEHLAVAHVPAWLAWGGALGLGAVAVLLRRKRR